MFFSSTYKLIMRLLIHGQEGQKHALVVMSFHPLRGGLTIFHPSTSWLSNVSTTAKSVTTCSQGYKFSSMQRRVTHFFIHPQAGYGSFQPQTRGLQHALEVMSFHSLSNGLHIFSSIYKLVTELFNQRQEGYNMLLRLRVFIH
jgi:hypothetical protein